MFINMQFGGCLYAIHSLCHQDEQCRAEVSAAIPASLMDSQDKSQQELGDIRIPYNSDEDSG